MCWRRFALCCCLGVAMACASGRLQHGVGPGELVSSAKPEASGEESKAPGDRKANDDAAEAGPCEPETAMGPAEVYLGDGVTDYHYYPIDDYLRENPGSEANTRAVERSEQQAAESPDSLKPPSADIVESEFSHLIGAIARDNGGIGAAVFDTTGLKVAAAGLEMEGLALPADRLATLKTAPEDPPVKLRYTCDELRAMTKTCLQNVIYGPPCYPLDDFAKHCKAPITVYYRPVIDYRRDMGRIGFSMLVVQDKPPCKDGNRDLRRGRRNPHP